MVRSKNKYSTTVRSNNSSMVPPTFVKIADSLCAFLNFMRKRWESAARVGIVKKLLRKYEKI